MSAQEKLQGKIAEMATDAILEGIMLIGGGSILDGEITKEQQIVRAYLLKEYGSREGADMEDALAEALGL